MKMYISRSNGVGASPCVRPLPQEHRRWPTGARKRRFSKTRRILFPYIFCMVLLMPLLAACTNQQTPPTSTQKPVTATATSAINCTAHSANPVTLNMYYGSEKQAWIQDVVSDFNSRNVTACDGPITVKATPVGSGTSMQQILDGSIQPDIWSPAGSVWLTQLNTQWATKHNGPTIVPTGANDVPPLVTSPVVIAMWKPEGRRSAGPIKPLAGRILPH